MPFRFLLFFLASVVLPAYTFAQAHHNENFDQFSHNYKHNSGISKEAKHKEHFKAESHSALEQPSHYKANQKRNRKSLANMKECGNAEVGSKQPNYKQQFQPKSRRREMP